MSKNVKFERNLLKTNEGMAPQSRQIFMTFVFCVQANGQPLPLLGWVPHEVGTLKRRPQNANFAADVNPTPTRNGCKYYGTTQITTRRDGEKNTHRKQKTEKKIEQPGTRLRSWGKRQKTGSNRKNIGKRSEPSNSPFTLPKLADFFFLCPRQCGTWTQAKK